MKHSIPHDTDLEVHAARQSTASIRVRQDWSGGWAGEGGARGGRGGGEVPI